jgi:digeranylgeranylglycerophospholipid reductase
LVVGGGPAGLSAAAAAAKGDLRVAVIEKDPSTAHAKRTSSVTWLQDMEKLQIPSRLCNPISRYGIYSPSKEYVLETPKAEACVLNVRGLYHYLAHQAATLGAEIFLGTRVHFASCEKDMTSVRISATSPLGQYDFHSSVVVDASGSSTVVGRSLGLVKSSERFGVGAEMRLMRKK